MDYKRIHATYKIINQLTYKTLKYQNKVTWRTHAWFRVQSNHHAKNVILKPTLKPLLKSIEESTANGIKFEVLE